MAVDLISTKFNTPELFNDASFRPIYYLGCKNSFVIDLHAAINDVDRSGGGLIDVFAGTGAVASSISKSRRVATVDIQEYSRVICSAILNPPNIENLEIELILKEISNNPLTLLSKWCFQPLIDYEHKCIVDASQGEQENLVVLMESPALVSFDNPTGIVNDNPLNAAIYETLERIKKSGLATSQDLTVSMNFGGVYFSYPQALILDSALKVAETKYHLKDTMIASSLSCASTIVNTVGKQFAQPIRPRNKSGMIKASLTKIVQRDRFMDAREIYKNWLYRYASLPNQKHKSLTIKDDYLTAINNFGGDYSVIYADPPYTRDHYSRFYHVLETMCLRDSPKITQVTKDGSVAASRGVYRESRHQSPFCIRSEAPNAFTDLFKAGREKDLPMVLSYSPHISGDGTHPRVVSMEQIIGIAETFYNRVELVFINGVTHNNLNNKSLKLKSRDHAEVILKCFL